MAVREIATSRQILSEGIKLAEAGNVAVALEALGIGSQIDIGYNGIELLEDLENALPVARAYELCARRTRDWFGLPPAGIDGPNGRVNLAYVGPNLIDDVNAPSRRIAAFLRYHDRSRFIPHVYSTEVFVKRERPLYRVQQTLPSSRLRAPKMVAWMNENGVPFQAARTDVNMLNSAFDLACRILYDRIDVAVFESSLACPIECLLAGWRVAPLQVNLNIGVPMFVKGIDCTLYFSEREMGKHQHYWESEGRAVRFMPCGVHIDDDPGPVPERKEFDIAEDAVLLATASNQLHSRLSPVFMDAVARLLKNNPNATYMLIGGGDLTDRVNDFKQHGVLDQIRWLGPRPNVRQLLQMADIYLNEFPIGGAQVVIEAMGVGLPVVAMEWSDKHQHCVGASHVGETAIIGARPDAYADWAQKLISDKDLRLSTGKAMAARARELYSFERNTTRFEQIYEDLLRGVTDGRQRHPEPELVAGHSG